MTGAVAFVGTLAIFATLRQVAGTDHHDLDDVDTVGAALQHNARLWDAVVPDGELVPGTIVLVNGPNIHHLQGLATPLQDGDRVSVFPAVGGG